MKKNKNLFSSRCELMWFRGLANHQVIRANSCCLGISVHGNIHFTTAPLRYIMRRQSDCLELETIFCGPEKETKTRNKFRKLLLENYICRQRNVNLIILNKDLLCYILRRLQMCAKLACGHANKWNRIRNVWTIYLTVTF